MTHLLGDETRFPICVWSTRTAPSNRCFKTVPIRRKSGVAFQHVFISQLPDIPWHLHRTSMLEATTFTKNICKWALIIILFI